ncbi:hypothetical protein DAPPUDRAFT_106807 [Daphnia pulex]|uniref:Peptidase A2 domain-containing protein n=1 Tax=Daphnia pulex TaxID=6669 RepID=E9GUZ7_DAPPU|nr:hypothetical protein DAPPUDRAFT_106807 [Daphnia pulex]|eukprot:EFX76577.1 hypothetical protein DAPPUDRAFT_106807 [Daphnia pulex]
MRRYANRMRKAFHLAYPISGKLDSATSASREQMMMDRFIEGLQPDLQARHKDFPSLEKLIDKAELIALTIEEAETRNEIHAVNAALETTANSEQARVVEALDRLNEKVEKKAATHQEEVELNLELMRKQLAQKQVQFHIPNQSFVTQPGAFKRAAVFCDFHNTEANFWVKEQMVNDRCRTCNKLGHRPHFCPAIRNPRPPHPSGQPVPGDCVVEALVDTGASKSLISDKILVQLKISGIPHSFSRDVSINLFDINDRRLSCIGTIKTNIHVENENTPEFLSQEFVVAQGIMEDCILGLDALYEHKFVIDGFEKQVYRVREPDQFTNRLEPFIMTGGKLTIPPFSACVMESGGMAPNYPLTPHSFSRVVQDYRWVYA